MAGKVYELQQPDAKRTRGKGGGGRGSAEREWQADLTRNSAGDCKATASNLQLILRNDDAIAGVFRFNAFSQRVDVVKPIPGPVSLDLGPMIDAHMAALGAWLSSPRTYGLSAKPAQLAEAIGLVAHEHAFHPPRDYLNGLKWDGNPRLHSFFPLYTGAPATAYEERVSQMLFVAVVARLFVPGCKVDFVVILESLHQGAGKTSLIRNLLNPDWYVEPVEQMGGREFLMSIRGAAIVELGELSVLSRADYNRVKQVITSQVDTYRDPFTRYVASFHRQCVFVGSTNQDNWNRDPTGARRFLPVRVSGIDLAGFLADRDQLWAEAVHLYREGFDYWTLPAAAEVEQDARFDDDVWTEPVTRWLEGKGGEKRYPLTVDTFPPSLGKGTGVRSCTANELLAFALNLEESKHDRPQQMRVAAIMTKLGWDKRRVMHEGVRAVRYYRPKEGDDASIPF